jgi:AraC-like DNA-binding protein
MHELDLAAARLEHANRGPAPRVSTLFARALIEAVEAAGTPVEQFLRAAGVDAARFDNPYAWLAVEELDQLIERAVEVTGDAAFGLHWSERSPMLKFDVLATATAYAPALRAALSCVLRFQTLLVERAELSLSEHEDSVLLRFSPQAQTELAVRVRTELAISSLVRLMHHVGAPKSAVQRIAFAHQAPAYRHEYARLLGARVRFAQTWSGLEIDARWLDRRVQHANAELHQLLSKQAQEILARVQKRVACAEQLRAYLRRTAPRLPDLREAARALALSERSLRRRLAEEGWSYTAIVHEARQHLARQLLADSLRPIHQIAADVGFNSSAAFFRAFKRWTGESPAAYRSARSGRVGADA